MAAARGYLLDTSVLSAFAPSRPPVPANLAEWVAARADSLYVPCIAVAEIEQGIRKLHRQGASAKARGLEKWLETLLEQYAERVLPLDAEASRVAGRLADEALAAGKHPGFADVAIAALAEHWKLCILTRNLRHFMDLGADCVDPFVQIPN